ncbi:hypothetical protein E4Q08_23825 [Candidatus Accumulibacter phosphatis]|uniref:Uncharacterized protein n=1 Tax=Candidatus Accumulibacter contiguus TaxID=2954381 RepID=A0ABX1THR4_9PROT|nr:hypothetical protein [Candidatus Accumulibacter contiguus]
MRRLDKSAQHWRCPCRILSGLVDTASDLARMAHLFPSGGFGAMYGEAVLRASFHAGGPTLGGVPGRLTLDSANALDLASHESSAENLPAV